MKHTPTLILLLLTLACAFAADITPQEAAKTQTKLLIALARAKDAERIKPFLFVYPADSTDRHQATVAAVTRLLGSIDPAKVSIQLVKHYENEDRILVRLNEPVMLDLDFVITKDTPPRILLKSIHP